MSSAKLKNNGGISKPFTPHATAKVPTIKNQTSSFEIPILGFGSGTAWYGANEGERKTNLKNSVKMAVKCGVHHIDCAEMYNNQEVVGDAIKEILNENNDLQREHLFVTSKIAQGSRNPNDVISSVHKTIADLNVGYLDLLLIHSPFGKPCPLIDTWKAMERLVDDGFVRHIGVSNHRIQDLQEILNSSKHRPVMNQVECHPALPQLKLKQFCEANDIIMASYGNLLPITRKPKECDPLNKTLTNIASKKKSINEGHLLLRWQLSNHRVAITTTSKESRLSEYLKSVEDGNNITGDDIENNVLIDQSMAGTYFRAFWEKQYNGLIE